MAISTLDGVLAGLQPPRQFAKEKTGSGTPTITIGIKSQG